MRKLLSSTLTPITISYEDVSNSRVKKEAGMDQVFNNLTYRYAASSDQTPYSDSITTESLNLNPSKTYDINFQRLANGSDAQIATQSYARYLAQRRERVKVKLSFQDQYNQPQTNLVLYNNPISLGSLISLNIVNNDFTIVGDYWVEKYTINPIDELIELELVQKLSGDNF